MNKRIKQALLPSILAVCAMSPQAHAADPTRICQRVDGTATETILPKEAAPNDPFGRVIGIFNGNFAGVSTAALSAILTTPPIFSPGFPVAPTPITVRHVFVTGPGDTITTLGKAFFNPGPATQPGEEGNAVSRCPGVPCMVQVPQTLDVTGGTGRWAGATGQLRNIGLGNLNLPQGQGSFTFLVSGEVCQSAGSVSAASQDRR